MFTPEGDFAQIHIAGEVPKIASGNRLAATPEEYAGIMRGTIAQFGTYTVDEDKQTFTMKFTASTYPNWEGTLQTRSVDKLTDDEFINTNPQVGAGRGSAYNLYRRARWSVEGRLIPSLRLRVPDAVQHEVMHRWSGTFAKVVRVTVPGLQRTAKTLRCARDTRKQPSASQMSFGEGQAS